MAFNVEVDIDPSVFTEDVEVLESYSVNEYSDVYILKSNRTDDIYYKVDEPELTYTFDEKVDWYDEVYDLEDLTRDYSQLLPILKKRVEDELKTDNLMSEDLDERQDEVREKARNIIDSINTGYELTDYPLNLVDYVNENVDSSYITESRPMMYSKKKTLDLSKKREPIPEEIYDKLLYYIVRDLAGYGRIQCLFDDDKIEEASGNRPNSPIVVYHSNYGEHILTNIAYDADEMAQICRKMGQQAGKNLSRANPIANGSLPDGSRVRLNYRREVSPEGSSFTIRYQSEVPLTPTSLINYETYNYEQMAYLWLLIENKKSVIVAGGTASGKTTTVNALTMFIDRNDKIVTIEDTQEVDIPHINHSKRVTRESIVEGRDTDIDEFDLTIGALRERPDFILVGEVRGEEAQSMFQAMNTGHATISTLHAEDPDSVIRRLESSKINVSKPMMEVMDLIIVQDRLTGSDEVRVDYVQEIEDINSSGSLEGSDMYRYDSTNDNYNKLYSNTGSNVLRDIMKSNKWDEEELNQELEDRKKVLRKMVEEELYNYVDCYTIFQAYMSDKNRIMSILEDEDRDLLSVTRFNAIGDTND